MSVKNWLLCATLLFSKAYAQNQIPPSSEILWQIKGLKNTASVLYIAAHPDDENTRFIAYLSKVKQVRTAYLSLTRGDGGQNLIGSEKGPLLGMIRTQELMMARSVDGGQQFFTRAYDFGYSKNPEETFQFWNKQTVLGDVVFAIRKFQPDIIVCRFPSTGEGGHGHHTASAILAQEAFDLANDPKAFPEQLSTTQIWQPKSLYWNTFNFGGTNTTSEDQIKIDVGVLEPLLGAFAGEVAAKSRSMHKSQGFGSSPSRGSGMEYFKYIKGEKTKSDLFENVPLNFSRFSETKNWDNEVEALVKNYNAAAPDQSLNQLIALYKNWNSKTFFNRDAELLRQRKVQDLSNIIREVAGIYIASTTTEKAIIRGKEIKVKQELVNGGKEDITWTGMAMNGKDSAFEIVQKPNAAATFTQSIQTQFLISSSPYWLTAMPKKGLYQNVAAAQVNQPINDAPITSTFKYAIRGQAFECTIPVLFTETDPVKGERKQPINILPQLNLQWSESPLLFNNGKTKTIQLSVYNYGEAGTYQIAWQTKGTQDYTVQAPKEILVPAKGKVDIPFSITPTKNAKPTSLHIQLNKGEQSFHESVTKIDYDHIPQQILIQDAALPLRNVQLQVPKEKFAYLPGAGDEVMETLQNIGVDIVALNHQKLASEDLKKYKAIITGVRAFNIDEQLSAYHQKLMDYIQQGGNLIVQYNTNSRVGPINIQIGPKPFEITRNRVTDETAQVELLHPQHVIFNQPNKINNDAFNDWVQERGIYFGKDTTQQYVDLIAMKDPGEALQKGSLMWLPYGKGNFFYTGLVFFRQLPEGNEGAYKLLLNMMGMPADYKLKP